jgi:hypothetical protein
MAYGPLRSIVLFFFHGPNAMQLTSPAVRGPTLPVSDGDAHGSPTQAAHAGPGIAGCELLADQPSSSAPWMMTRTPDASVSAPPVSSRMWRA